MKRNIILVIIITFILIISVFNLSYIYAETNSGFGTGYDSNLIPSNKEEVDSNIKKPVEKIWNSAILILQIVSVAGIIATGLRYMLESADKKADLKQGLVPLTIGCVLVFGATTVIKFVRVSFSQAIGEGKIYNATIIDDAMSLLDGYLTEEQVNKLKDIKNKIEDAKNNYNPDSEIDKELLEERNKVVESIYRSFLTKARSKTENPNFDKNLKEYYKPRIISALEKQIDISEAHGLIRSLKNAGFFD